MKTLLLGVTLGLAAALSFALKEEDITGTWYVKAVVTNKDLPEEKRPRKVSPMTVTILDHGDLEATFTFLRNDWCFQKKILMQKMEEPGKFSSYGGRKLIYLRELPGRDHYVFHCKDQRHGGLFRMGELVVMGRGHLLSASAACRARPLSPPRLIWPPHLQVGIPTPTWRPWKNLRNPCSTRDSRRGTFSCPCRWEAVFLNTRVTAPGSVPPESTLPPDTEPGPPGPTLQP
ncbi:odorant-binding protein 2a isoform X1 [Aotus nancymaae]|uniref:odorant-binding protein 2a isoform X1 n=1 Tax=Aotus nancymaae TaxID=37293 RepID=UPI0030FE9A09